MNGALRPRLEPMPRLHVSNHPPELRLFYAYIILALIVFPFIAVLRPFGMFDPRSLYFLNLFAVFGLALWPSSKRWLAPRSGLQWTIIALFVWGGLLGIGNLWSESRNYWSHAFQLASAYLVFSLGFAFPEYLLRRPRIRQIMWLVVAANAVTLGIVIRAWQLGIVGRVYTGGYHLLLPTSYFLTVGSLGAVMTMLLALFSAKRGAAVAVAAMLLASFTVGRRTATTGVRRMGKLLAVAAIIVGGLLIVFRDQLPPFGRAVMSRYELMWEAHDLDRASAGRFSEAQAALKAAGISGLAFGGGFGFTYDRYNAQNELLREHNVHVSPITFAVRFGIPMTVLFYLVLLGTICAGYLRGRRGPTDRSLSVWLLYVTGALVYSLTAFSIFIDLLFFFAVGRVASKYRSAL